MTGPMPPHPIPDPDTQGYWDATARGELALARCVDCRRWQHPPFERCRHCVGRVRFEPVLGTGVIHSFIVSHRAVAPAFADQTPYAIAIVELDDQTGLRIVGRVVDVAPDQVTIGSRARVRIEPIPGSAYGSVAVEVGEDPSPAVTGEVPRHDVAAPAGQAQGAPGGGR